MPAHRKPTNVLKLTGALAKDPGRFKDRAEEPAPDQPFPVEAPAHLTAAARKCWLELVASLPPGVAFDSDKQAMEQLANLLAFCRKYKWQVDMKVHAQFLRLLGVFGMTPADRSRIRVAPKSKEDGKTPDAEFSKARKA